jgi:hypothetical protein
VQDAAPTDSIGVSTNKDAKQFAVKSALYGFPIII